MWFMDNIVQWLGTVTDWFYDAYLEVRGWVIPFYYLSTPLYWLYYAFWYITYYFGQFNIWLDWAAGRLDAILSYSNIASYFKWWFDAAANAWSWVLNAVANVTTILNTWWSSTSLTVQGWVNEAMQYAASLYTTLQQSISSLQTAWDNFKGKIPTIDSVISWWSNWTGNVLSTVNTWWQARLIDVRNLINSAFTERESFWSGWQDFRDRVAEFFTDPLGWLESKFTDWFLGPEG